MTQHSMTVPEGSGLAVRSGLNQAIQALASNNSGDAEPATKFPCMFWPDTANKLLWMRTTGNDAWFPLGKLNADNLGMLMASGGSMSGALNESMAAAVASVSSPDIWAVSGNTIHITGSAPIGGFAPAPQAGAHRTLVFDGALTLTNSGNLILPSGTNITTAAGDSCVVLAETKTTFRVVSYSRADGTAVRVAASTGNPTGTIINSACSSVPTGYLLCDGSAVSRSAYAALFAAIGTTYGAGDGSSTFNIPDARGVVLRGVDGGRGIDSGRSLGSYQADAIASHAVSISDPGHTHTLRLMDSGTGYNNYGFALKYLSSNGSYNPATTSGPTNASGTGISASYSGAAETRMKNLAVNYFIKY